MKICFREKCQKEFEPNKPKQIFCSAKCRVYFSRESKTANNNHNKTNAGTKKEERNKPANSIMEELERQFQEEISKLKNK